MPRKGAVGQQLMAFGGENLPILACGHALSRIILIDVENVLR
jgi:hypothetical protein